MKSRDHFLCLDTEETHFLFLPKGPEDPQLRFLVVGFHPPSNAGLMPGEYQAHTYDIRHCFNTPLFTFISYPTSQNNQTIKRRQCVSLDDRYEEPTPRRNIYNYSSLFLLGLHNRSKTRAQQKKYGNNRLSSAIGAMGFEE